MLGSCYVYRCVVSLLGGHTHSRRTVNYDVAVSAQSSVGRTRQPQEGLGDVAAQHAPATAYVALVVERQERRLLPTFEDRRAHEAGCAGEYDHPAPAVTYVSYIRSNVKKLESMSGPSCISRPVTRSR